MDNLKLNTSYFSCCIIAAVLFLLPSCYEKKETCLDIRATNLDLDGDIACEDCCEYPKLKFEFRHREIRPTDTVKIGFSGEVFDYTKDSVYFDANDNPFRIESIQYYVSNMRLVATDGTEAQINEEIEIQTATGVTTYKDDFLRVNARSLATLSAGSFSTIKTYNKVRFSIGMNADIDSAIPASMPDNHVLSIDGDSTLYDTQNNHYLMGNIGIYRDTTTNDTIAVQLPITLVGNGPIDIELLFPESVVLPEGFHFKITLLINCPTWFEMADIYGNSSLLAESIVSKMSNSISLLEIKVESD